MVCNFGHIKVAVKYKKPILFTGMAALAILYALWKRSPVIAKSLENEGFKLVSHSKNKNEIYKRILLRYGEELNRDIKLDEYLTAKDQKHLALSFWCDFETSGKRFFVSLDNYRKYCTMSISDYLIDEKEVADWKQEEDSMYINDSEFYESKQKYKELFSQKKIIWKDEEIRENYDRWIRWCKVQKYLKWNINNLDIFKGICLN